VIEGLPAEAREKIYRGNAYGALPPRSRVAKPVTRGTNA
jgi:hypothetical protein